jgi:hypothetical protein
LQRPCPTENRDVIADDRAPVGADGKAGWPDADDHRPHGAPLK